MIWKFWNDRFKIMVLLYTKGPLIEHWSFCDYSMQFSQCWRNPITFVQLVTISSCSSTIQVSFLLFSFFCFRNQTPQYCNATGEFWQFQWGRYWTCESWIVTVSEIHKRKIWSNFISFFYFILGWCSKSKLPSTRSYVGRT